MAFGNAITRLSELIADSVTGAIITGGQIIGAAITADAAVLTNPDINGGTQDSATQTGGTITGALIRTAVAGLRWEIDSAIIDEIRAYTGRAAEINPAFLQVLGTATNGILEIVAPQFTAGLTKFRLENDSSAPAGNQRTMTTVTDILQFNAANAAFFGGTVFAVLSNNLHNLLVDNSGITINNTAPILGVDFGAWAGNTNGAATIVNQPHNLGVTPAYVGVNQSSGSGAGRVRSVARTAAKFDVVVNNTTTGAGFAAGSAFGGEYFAIG